MTDRLHLETQHRTVLQALVQEHLPGVEVWAYGSCINGSSHNGSHLNLVLRGAGLKEIPAEQLVDFEEAVRESRLPFLVEARDWARLSEQVRGEIERGDVVLMKEIRHHIRQHFEGKILRDNRLRHYAEIIMGQSPPGNTYNKSGEGVPLLNGPTEFNSHHPTAVQFTTDARRIAKPNDLLFCVRGSTGRMNWADREYAIGRGIAAIRDMRGSQFQRFLQAVVEFNLPDLLAGATGSTFPNVSAQQLLDIPWPFHSVPEQRAIAHILGTLDDKIELNRRMNETLEAMAQAIFKDWFVDFGPVRAKMEGRAPYLPKGIWDLFPDGMDDEGKPEGWKTYKLSDLALHHRATISPPTLSASSSITASQLTIPRMHHPSILAIQSRVTKWSWQKVRFYCPN